jgi:hypothetical protein
MDFTGWVPPEIKIGCGIILALAVALVGILYFHLAR